MTLHVIILKGYCQKTLQFQMLPGSKCRQPRQQIGIEYQTVLWTTVSEHSQQMHEFGTVQIFREPANTHTHTWPQPDVNNWNLNIVPHTSLKSVLLLWQDLPHGTLPVDRKHFLLKPEICCKLHSLVHMHFRLLTLLNYHNLHSVTSSIRRHH